MGCDMVDAFRFLIMEEGRGLYSGFLFFSFSFVFSFFLLLRCFESMVRILLGLFRLGFMSCHSSSYKCSQKCPLLGGMYSSRLGNLPHLGKFARNRGGGAEKPSFMLRYDTYDSIPVLRNYALLSYANPSEKGYCSQESRKVSKRKFLHLGGHSGVTSGSNRSAIPRG